MKNQLPVIQATPKATKKTNPATNKKGGKQASKKGKSRAGRPGLVLTTEVRKRLLEAREDGMGWKACARYAGVSYQTLLNWRARAVEALAQIAPGGEREGKRPLKDDMAYIQFYEEMEKARPVGEKKLLKSMMKAAGGQTIRETVITEILKPDPADPTNATFIVVGKEVRSAVKEVPINVNAGIFMLKYAHQWAERAGEVGAPAEDELDVDLEPTKDAWLETLEAQKRMADEALSVFDDLEPEESE
jgi:hypothetical protein